MNKIIVPKHHTLACVIGLSSQIITETLYALMVQQIPPISVSEIFVFTTSIGKSNIIRTILGSNGALDQFYSEYSLEENKIKFDENHILTLTDSDGIPLEDIRTASDNVCASNQILSFIQKLSKDNNRIIHASIAGGRKTMGVYLAFAMQLFGREHDKLYHILVDTDCESNQNFFFPKKGDICSVQLAEVPFLRLKKYVIPSQNQNIYDYEKIVSHVQESLAFHDIIQPLYIILHNRTITIGETTICLPPKLFVLYELFVRFRLSAGENIHSADTSWYVDLVSLTSKENTCLMLESYSRYYSCQSPYYINLMQTGPDAGFSLPTLRSDICKINRLIKHTLDNVQAFFYMIDATENSYGSTRYGIPSALRHIEIEE